MKKILVLGATGQIGTELTPILRRRIGDENVIAASRHRPKDDHRHTWSPFEVVDVTSRDDLARLIERHRPDTIFHLAAMLSAVAEQHPQVAWTVNVDGLCNVLEAARQGGVGKVFWPSSIGAFGPNTPRDQTPQETIREPTTIYGITKVTGELLCDYYVTRHGLDVRGVRYPGVIGSDAPPGGGTTDFAVEIFHAAVETGRYTCFVREDTVLPMIYMPDCIHAALQLMDADFASLQHHNGFNVAAMSFSAGELAAEIKKHLPHFECRFEPDERQQIADSWPRSLDDAAARTEWNWSPQYDLAAMTLDMLRQLGSGGDKSTKNLA